MRRMRILRARQIGCKARRIALTATRRVARGRPAALRWRRRRRRRRRQRHVAKIVRRREGVLLSARQRVATWRAARGSARAHALQEAAKLRSRSLETQHSPSLSPSSSSPSSPPPHSHARRPLRASVCYTFCACQNVDARCSRCRRRCRHRRRLAVLATVFWLRRDESKSANGEARGWREIKARRSVVSP